MQERSYEASFHRMCEHVKRNVPLLEYAKTLTEMKRSGGVWVGCCPLSDHEDRTPSFTVWADAAPEEQGWWCFGCDRGSDVIDLHGLIAGHSETWTAMVSLCDAYGLELPERPERWKKAQSRKSRYEDAALAVKGRVLARRIYAVRVLPFIMAIGDQAERERELERSWRDWQRQLPWSELAYEVLHGPRREEFWQSFTDDAESIERVIASSGDAGGRS